MGFNPQASHKLFLARRKSENFSFGALLIINLFLINQYPKLSWITGGTDWGPKVPNPSSSISAPVGFC
jgi:hypothetical protein